MKVKSIGNTAENNVELEGLVTNITFWGNGECISLILPIERKKGRYETVKEAW